MGRPVPSALIWAAAPVVGCVAQSCPEGTALADDGYCWRAPGEPAPIEAPACVPRNPREEPGPDLCMNPYPGDLVLRNDEEVAAICPTWDCVSGGVQIGGLEGPGGPTDAIDITDLSPLACLKYARFFMISSTTRLTDVTLPGLVATGGGFTIALNPGLRSLSAPSLQYVAGDLSIQMNDTLEALDLPRLGRVGEFFLIVDNPALPADAAWALRDGLCDDGVGGATSVFGNGP